MDARLLCGRIPDPCDTRFSHQGPAGRDPEFRRARSVVQHCGDARMPDRRGHSGSGTLARSTFVRDAGGLPTGHAVEGAAVTPMMSELGAFTEDTVRASQELTIGMAPSWGITAYMEAGVILGPNANAEMVYRDLAARDEAGQIPLRIVGTVWTREPADDPAAVVATLKDWSARIKSEHVQVAILKQWADGTSFSGGALLLEPFLDAVTGTGRGSMTFSPEHIERQIELAQRAGFDMHIHIEADGSARVVLDAIASVQRRIGRGESRHAICHSAFVHPDDVKRFAELGVIANCTPLWGTDYDGQFLRYLRREARRRADGAAPLSLRRPGAQRGSRDLRRGHPRRSAARDSAADPDRIAADAQAPRFPGRSPACPSPADRPARRAARIHHQRRVPAPD